MSDQTPRVPELWWSDKSGLFRGALAGGVYVNPIAEDLGTYLSPMTWNHLPADAVKLVPVGNAFDESVALHEIREVLDEYRAPGPHDPIAALADIRAIVEGETR